jgi:hypothetical protein
MAKRVPKRVVKVSGEPAEMRSLISNEDQPPPPFVYVVVWPLEVTPALFVSDGKGGGRAEYYVNQKYRQQPIAFSHQDKGWYFFNENGTTRQWTYSVQPLPATGTPPVWGVNYRDDGGNWLKEPQNARKIVPEDFGL